MESVDRLRRTLSDRYLVEGEVGAGGMATVYHARELRHDRDVAIKVLHSDLAATLGRDRFLSEVRTTARLQHPHILPVLDSGELDGLLFYVMPLVAGETLRRRLDRERQLPVDEAIAIARQVCDALAYAHQHGIVHRDIKPENILLQSGHALVADFGIALALERAGGTRLTATGISVGTPQYMSPEQAAADTFLDARTDIYSLAVVVYEMLVGEPPFHAPTPRGVIARVLTDRPTAARVLRESVPPHVDRALMKALAKLPADRFATITQFGDALVTPRHSPGEHRDAAARPSRSRRVLWATGAAGLALGLAGGLVLSRRDAELPPAARYFSVVLPPELPIALTGPAPMGIWQTALAISPGGGLLAYASLRDENTQIVVRRLDRDSSIVVPGTDGAYFPFISPDGATIGFFSGRELRKVSVQGGSPVTLARVDRPTGAVWVSPDSILLFEEDGFTMRWIRSSGGDAGEPRRLTTQFGTPDVLPGGQWVVGQMSSGQLGLLSLADTSLFAISRRGVISVDSVALGDILFGASPRWVESSRHLVFASGDGVLMGLPFDGKRRRVTGQPVPLLNDVRVEDGFGYGEFAISREGTLVYVPGNNQLYGRIALLDAKGRLDTLPFPRGAYTQLRASPDGEQLAIQQRAVGGWEILRFDFSTGVRSRVPVEGNYRAFPAAWRPPGRELLIGLWDPVRFLFLGARLQPLYGGVTEDFPFQGISYLTFTPDGERLAFSDWRTGDLFIAPLRGDTTRTRVPGRGFASNFSPDGRWLAYGDVDGGISVSPVPPTGEIIRAAERGQQPLWSPDGTRLIFRDGRRFYQSTLSTSGRVRFGTPTLVGEGPFVRTFAWNHSIAPDGRLVVSVASPERATRELRVISGFPAELQRRVPVGTK